jgi:hypothetical protein
MTIRHSLLSGFAALLLTAGIAQAGPCNTANNDAGSGPTPGARAPAETSTGIAPQRQEHPPTSNMNNTAGDTATSSQDAQRQMQGQPTAAQEAQGAKVKPANDC